MRYIVTGAAGGIGRATAHRLVQDAKARHRSIVQLTLVDCNQAALEETVGELRSAGAEIEAVFADLVDPAMPKEILERAVGRFGGLEGLVSNAGIVLQAPLLDLSLEDYDRTFAVNTRSTWLLAKAAYPYLRQSRGAIVATASIAAHEPCIALGAYAASKAALLMLIRQLACDWGPVGIRSNTVSPGTTPRLPTAKAETSLEAGEPPRVGSNPLGTVAEPSDQAAAIAFLLSPDARFINGADIVVDGGARTQLMQALGLARSRPLGTSI